MTMLAAGGAIALVPRLPPAPLPEPLVVVPLHGVPLGMPLESATGASGWDGSNVCLGVPAPRPGPRHRLAADDASA